VLSILIFSFFLGYLCSRFAKVWSLVPLTLMLFAIFFAQSSILGHSFGYTVAECGVCAMGLQVGYVLSLFAALVPAMRSRFAKARSRPQNPVIVRNRNVL